MSQRLKSLYVYKQPAPLNWECGPLPPVYQALIEQWSSCIPYLYVSVVVVTLSLTPWGLHLYKCQNVYGIFWGILLCVVLCFLLYHRHQMTPLMYACQHNRVLLAQLLLAHNADADIKDIRGWTVSFIKIGCCLMWPTLGNPCKGIIIVMYASYNYEKCIIIAASFYHYVRKSVHALLCAFFVHRNFALCNGLRVNTTATGLHGH